MLTNKPTHQPRRGFPLIAETPGFSLWELNPEPYPLTPQKRLVRNLKTKD